MRDESLSNPDTKKQDKGKRGGARREGKGEDGITKCRQLVVVVVVVMVVVVEVAMVLVGWRETLLPVAASVRSN